MMDVPLRPCPNRMTGDSIASVCGGPADDIMFMKHKPQQIDIDEKV